MKAFRYIQADTTPTRIPAFMCRRSGRRWSATPNSFSASSADAARASDWKRPGRSDWLKETLPRCRLTSTRRLRNKSASRHDDMSHSPRTHWRANYAKRSHPDATIVIDKLHDERLDFAIFPTRASPARSTTPARLRRRPRRRHGNWCSARHDRRKVGWCSSSATAVLASAGLISKPLAATSCRS